MRVDDIKTVARLIPRLGMGWAPERDDECDAIQRILPEAIAALRFVEEHGATVRKALFGGVLTPDVQRATEALRRLTAGTER